LKPVGIVGTGSYVPEKVLTNADLEKMVDTSDEWIRTRTGIRERHIADEKTATSDLAVEAAKRALQQANLKGEDVELTIVATITPDMFFPSTACFVQDKIGACGHAAFDVSAACSGFVYALACAHQLVANGVFKNALIIGAETLSKFTDWEDRNTCVLLADGAGAVVLKPLDTGRGILSFSMGADGSLGHLLYLPGGGSRNPVSSETVKERLHYIKMKGNELFKIAVRVLVDAALSALNKGNISPADVDLFIPHQANIRIIDAVVKRLGIPEDRVHVNVDRFGNTSAASIPIALDEANRMEKLKKGDIVVLDAFGGGLTWGACVLEW
jgi:3-oxoacyl-[acyl-carrier-protein] synthase-3